MIQNALNFKKELENPSFTLKVIFDMVFTIVILSVALNWLVGLILRIQITLPIFCICSLAERSTSFS